MRVGFCGQRRSGQFSISTHRLHGGEFGVTERGTRQAAQTFSLNTLNGKPWRFEDQSGKVVLVNYWATWCGPCRFEMPGLVNIHKDSGAAISVW